MIEIQHNKTKQPQIGDLVQFNGMLGLLCKDNHFIDLHSLDVYALEPCDISCMTLENNATITIRNKQD